VPCNRDTAPVATLLGVRQSEYRRNHIASRCYLAGWADSAGQIAVVSKERGSIGVRRPERVGFRDRFWGQSVDLRARVERTFGRVESAAADLIPALSERWPLPAPSPSEPAAHDLTVLLQFVALHLVRTPAWRDVLLRARQASVERSIHATTEHADDVISHVMTDGFVASMTLANVPRVASVLGGMHRTLLRFDAPLLVTSDQPVTPVPLVRGADQMAPIGVVPADGLMAMFECRFPVSPRYALLFTWLDASDGEEIVDCGFAEACWLNTATATQSDEEMFHCSGHSPAFVLPPWARPEARSIADVLYPGYDMSSALNSERRRQSLQVVDAMIEGDVTDRVNILSVRSAA
jgi:hypothetical protein